MIHNEPQGTILGTKNGPKDAQERLRDQHSNLVHQKGLKNTKFDDETVPNYTECAPAPIQCYEQNEHTVQPEILV